MPVEVSFPEYDPKIKTWREDKTVTLNDGTVMLYSKWLELGQPNELRTSE